MCWTFDIHLKKTHNIQVYTLLQIQNYQQIINLLKIAIETKVIDPV